MRSRSSRDALWNRGSACRTCSRICPLRAHAQGEVRLGERGRAVVIHKAGVAIRVDADLRGERGDEARVAGVRALAGADLRALRADEREAVQRGIGLLPRLKGEEAAVRHRRLQLGGQALRRKGGLRRGELLARQIQRDAVLLLREHVPLCLPALGRAHVQPRAEHRRRDRAGEAKGRAGAAQGRHRTPFWCRPAASRRSRAPARADCRTGRKARRARRSHTARSAARPRSKG